MIETAHSYQHPYKPKQRFSHYSKTPDPPNGCPSVEPTYRTSEGDQPTPTAVIHHHHYLSQGTTNLVDTTYQPNGKDDFRSPAPSASIGMPLGPSHDMARSKSSPPLPSSLPGVKHEPNLEQKQFADNTHHAMASLMKANNGKMPGSMTVHVPCLVCSDEASGFHYGVNSCEGCKVRMSVRVHAPFLCKTSPFRGSSVDASPKECLIGVTMWVLAKSPRSAATPANTVG